MGCSERYKKTYSSGPYSKSAGFKPFLKLFTFTTLMSLVIGLGCSSTNKNGDFSVSAQKDSREAELFQLTSIGSNSQATYHPSGTKFIYISADRESHKEGQVYEMEILDKVERRISFNAGTDAQPIYHPRE